MVKPPDQRDQVIIPKTNAPISVDMASLPVNFDEALAAFRKPAGTPGKPSGTPGKPAGTPGKPATSEDTRQIAAIAAASARATIEFDKQIHNLPPQQRVFALIGTRNPFEILDLPEPFKVLSATCSKDQFTKVKAILNNYGIELSSDFAGDSNDEQISLTYIIPEADIAQQILLAFNRGGIQCNLAMAANQTPVLRIANAQLMSLHSQLNDQIGAPGQNAQAKTVNTEIPGAIENISIARGLTLNQEPSNFSTVHATPASLQEGKKLENKGFEMPRKGACSYLMIDLDFLTDVTAEAPQPNQASPYEKLRDELKMISDSPDFHFTTRNGYLVIIGTAERAGSSMALMANRIKKELTDSKMILGHGEIKYLNPQKFEIKGFPKTESRKNWENLQSGVYMTGEFYKVISDPKRRDSTIVQVKASKSAVEGLMGIEQVRAKPALSTGGPDVFIGPRENLDKLKAGLKDGRTSLILIKGKAGLGKSTYINEALLDLPKHTLCRLEDMGSRVPGFALMTIAEQIADKFDDPENAAILNKDPAKRLKHFVNKGQSGMLQAVQKNPGLVVDICFEALKLLSIGMTPFIVDDVHHSDRFSISHIRTLAERYCLEAGQKTVLLMRPEQMEIPQEVKNLEAAVDRSKGGIATLNLLIEGLNFADHKISHDFAYHSIPAPIREGKVLDTWYQKMGKIAGNSGWVFSNMMRGHIHDRHFIIKDNVILLNKAGQKLIDSVAANDDVNAHYKTRLDRLKGPGLRLLQCIALLGGKLTSQQIGLAATVTGIRSTEDFQKVAIGLRDGGHLLERSKGNWTLEHESIREVVIDSMGEDQALGLASRLFTVFGKDPNLHIDFKFQLAHIIASAKKPPVDDDPFWEQYREIAGHSIKSATEMHEFERGYGVAKTILDPKNGSQPIMKAVSALTRDPKTSPVHPAIAQTTINALRGIAFNALYLGKFKETEQAVKILGDISTSRPELGIDMTEAYLILFQAYYLQAKPSGIGLKNDFMKDLFEKKIEKDENIHPGKKTLLKIEMAYRRGDYEAVNAIYKDEHAFLESLNRDHIKEKVMPSPDFVNAFRLVNCRCNFEEWRRGIKKNLDDDSEVQPGSITAESAARLLEIRSAIVKLGAIRARFPETFNPYEEIYFLEGEARIAAYFGEFQGAYETLGEVWRQANQMGIHVLAAYLAKYKADRKISEGTILVIKTPSANSEGKVERRRIVDKDCLEEAIRVLSNEGMISLANLKENPNDISHLIVRAERIMAIGELLHAHASSLASTDPMSKKRTKFQLETYVINALEDYRIINETSAGQPEGDAWHEDVSTGVYLSYIGFVFEAAKLLGIPLPRDLEDPVKYPFMHPERIIKSYNLSTTMHDNGAGTLDSKVLGFQKLVDFLKSILAQN